MTPNPQPFPRWFKNAIGMVLRFDNKSFGTYAQLNRMSTAWELEDVLKANYYWTEITSTEATELIERNKNENRN